VKFTDRHEAGRQLGSALVDLTPADPVVSALPRGGVPVGFEVASSLDCPLDVLIVRKIGLPSQPELAMGAVGEGDVVIRNRDVITMAGVTEEVFAAALRAVGKELADKIATYRAGAPPVELGGRTSIIVDDGLATGSTALAAVEVARKRGARAVWVAVPVAPHDTVGFLRAIADEVVVLHQPRRFFAVGAWYQDFTQTKDVEVRDLLDRSRSS
jgi:putative phosphoribosyl transferase